MIYEVMRGMVKLLALVVLGGRLRIEGIEHVPPTGSALLVGNHAGAVDPVLLGISLRRRDVYYMAKSELFRKPASRWLFSHCHAFPVVRDSPDRGALTLALQHLRDGHLLVVYPEGTREAEGGAASVHAGVGFIVRHARVPVVPVATWGSERVLPRGAWLPRRADAGIRIGTPLRLPDAGALGRRLTNQAAAEVMMAAVRRLQPAAAASGPRRLRGSPAA